MNEKKDLPVGVVVHSAGDLRVERVEREMPSGDEATVSITFGGICGSDLHYWLDGAAGESILKAPMLLGHEVVGTVIRAAADGTGPGVGADVAVHPATPAVGDGSRFPSERPNLCPGGTYLGSAARYPHTNGAFASEVNLPTRMLYELPSGLTLRQAALAEPASVAWHAVSRAGDVSGKRVLVIGAGPIGCLVVAILKRAGAAEIVVTDVYPKPLHTASAVGASETLLSTEIDAISAVDADVAIESSGSARGLASAITGVMRGGRVVMLGLLPAGDQPVPASIAITRELELVGSFRFNEEMTSVLASLVDGSLFVDPIVTHEFDVADSLKAFETARDSSSSGKVLLRF